jgi:hypothetical protein
MTPSEIVSRYTAGAPFLHEGCPDPTTFDVVDPTHAASVFNNKTASREQWIASYLEANPNEPRFMAAMKHDMEQAKMTTNRDQLLELCILVPIPSEISRRSDKWCHNRLWNIIYGLARMGIFLTHSEHLDDRTLLNHLVTRVLLDEIPDLPPNPDMSEFLDLNPTNIDALMVDSVDDEGNTVKVPFYRNLPTPDRTIFDAV